MSHSRFPIFLLLGAIATAPIAANAKAIRVERSEAYILKTVKLPDGCQATVFALPPEGHAAQRAC